MRHFRTEQFLAALAVLASFVSGAAAADWQQGAPPSWAQTLAEAKLEGKVTVAGPEALARPFAEEFRRDTGIELEFLGGSPRELTARVDREVKARTLTVDIVLGGGAELLGLYPQKLLEPVKPQLLLPGVTEPQNWIGGKLKWMDPEESYFLQGSNWVFGWPVINSAQAPEGTVKSWKDFLKPQFSGKIVAYDPRSGGPGQAAAGYLDEQFGTPFLTSLYAGQKAAYTRDGRQLVEWIVRGNYTVAFAAVAADVETFRSQGIGGFYVPQLEDGPGSLLGGYSVLKQPVGAPHRKAATVFINWYMSQPGQTVYSRVMLEPSLRTDVVIPNMPDYIKPKPGVAYIDQYRGDWYLNTRPKLELAVNEALGGR